jgi:hypothetical protein
MGYLWLEDLGLSPPITSMNMEETPLMVIEGVETKSYDTIEGIDVNFHDKRFIRECEGNSSNVHQMS